ncbi:MAG: hypothetical protein ACPG4Z_00770 [Chitinophagales bacterium]
MNNLGLIILTFVMSDSTTVSVEDTLVVKESVVFRKNDDNSTTMKYQYKHQQGFFCDFEDKISEKRKININLGVGDQ